MNNPNASNIKITPIDLKSVITPLLAPLKEIQEILRIEQDMFDQLEDDLNEIFTDEFIETASSQGIARREKMLGIAPFNDDTIESRRFRVSVLWNNAGPYTVNRIREMLQLLLGADGYTFQKDYGNYALVITISLGQKRMRDAIETMLLDIIPANMAITVSLQYNRHLDLIGYTHQELAAKTHYQLREEVL